MNFYYTLNDAEAMPQFLGNFNSYHQGEREVRRLLDSSSGLLNDGYLFLHRSALPWQDQHVKYLGPFRLVRIISNRPPRMIGTAQLLSRSLADKASTTFHGQLCQLPKAS